MCTIHVYLLRRGVRFVRIYRGQTRYCYYDISEYPTTDVSVFIIVFRNANDGIQYKSQNNQTTTAHPNNGDEIRRTIRYGFTLLGRERNTRKRYDTIIVSNRTGFFREFIFSNSSFQIPSLQQSSPRPADAFRPSVMFIPHCYTVGSYWRRRGGCRVGSNHPQAVGQPSVSMGRVFVILSGRTTFRV